MLNLPMMFGGRFAILVSVLVTSSLIYIYFSSNVKLRTSFGSIFKTNPNINDVCSISSREKNKKFKEKYCYRNIGFNKDSGDIFSFVHIQKTGGTTMEKHLIHNINNSNCHCEKTRKPSCMCYNSDDREIWLVCRYIQPKWPCGLHPDYVTLKDCTPNFISSLYGYRPRRYFYGTILRNPMHRFLSEFRHMQRGASWEAAASLCRGQLLMNQIPSCFEGKFWNGLTIEKFLSCPYNLAINRQTWMLSNISEIGCNFKRIMFNAENRKRILSIAKRNIDTIAYFGILEYPLESQFVFEKTFNLTFIQPFQQWDTGFAIEYLKTLPESDETIKRIKKLNRLDFELYRYAKEVFFERYNYFVKKYGIPRKVKPLKTSRYSIAGSKLDRIKKNLPRSKSKELILRKKREREKERLKLKNKKKAVMYNWDS